MYFFPRNVMQRHHGRPRKIMFKQHVNVIVWTWFSLFEHCFWSILQWLQTAMLFMIFIREYCFRRSRKKLSYKAHKNTPTKSLFNVKPEAYFLKFFIIFKRKCYLHTSVNSEYMLKSPLADVWNKRVYIRL